MTTIVDGPELDATAWGTNPNCVDIATVGGKTYLVAYTPSFFPNWYLDATLYIYDITEPGKFNDNQLFAVETRATATDSYSDVVAGAVSLVPSDNSVAIYYVDHNSELLGGYTIDANTGVEDIEVSKNSPAVYYNLQGVQVENPANGLFIVKHDNKVTKRYIK